MTTYFITGGLGFLGQYIVKAIHDYDPTAELRVMVRTQRKTFLGIESLPGVRWVHGDLLQPESYAEHLRGVDAVIHNAAMVSFRKSDADAIIRANVEGTHNLIQAARAAGCPNFIFISSISALGFQPGRIIDEDMLPDLETKRRTDAYGYSKLVSENELRGMSRNLRVVMLNPSVILGPGSERVEMVRRAARWLFVLPMLDYINTFVDVRDVARAVTLALTQGRSGERYIVTAWNVGMVEFTRTALKVLGKRALILPLGGAGIRFLDGLLTLLDKLHLNPGIRRLSEVNVDKPCSSDKLRREMGWEPAFTLEQSLSDTLKGGI
ncbi:MAG: NAD-dependent epimerase/dehydratase family protein [Chloroflexi bacterium]|nr:NAD-dependent epimerase/dehydratase family protein [Chloroflexota bacterium]